MLGSALFSLCEGSAFMDSRVCLTFSVCIGV